MAETFTIRAEAHSDDRIFEANFDALPFFEQASDEEITALQACGWGGDYPADAVADFCVDNPTQHADLVAMFGYLERIANIPSKRDEHGYECHVNEEDALAWLQTHRPTLHATLVALAQAEE